MAHLVVKYKTDKQLVVGANGFVFAIRHIFYFLEMS